MTRPSYTAPPKDPADVESYSLDCSAWLAGETISSRTVVADDPTLVISGLTDSAGVVRWRASAGTAGQACKMKATVTSSSGRVAERTILLPVRDL